MRRRAFLRLTIRLVLGVLAFLGLPRAARARETIAAIHDETRNTLLGALGAGLRRLRAPLPPYKAYAGRPRVALPDVRRMQGLSLVDAFARAGMGTSDTLEPAALTRERLARLLFFANGDTGRGDGDPYALRAAPSAGALYAGELYALVRRVEGIEPGIYYYDVGKHALVRIGEKDTLPAYALEGASHAGADLLICLTNVFERYERRYRNRGYRYALIDTGHIGENLLLEAASLGVPAAAPARFCDDAFNQALGIDGKEEAVCAVYVVGGPAAIRAHDDAVDSLVEKQVAKADSVARDLRTTLRYHDATKLVPKAQRNGRAASRSDSRARAHRATGAAAAPTHVGGFPNDVRQALIRPLEACVVARRSPRAFARTAIDGSAYHAVLVAAHTTSAGAADDALELRCFVHRVAGTEAGLYRWERNGQRLEAIATRDFSDALVAACLRQSKAGDAAAAIAVTADLGALESRGARAYRDVLIASGRVAERIYLAAEAAGVRARNLAAFVDDDLNELCGLARSKRRVVHLIVVGKAA